MARFASGDVISYKGYVLQVYGVSEPYYKLQIPSGAEQLPNLITEVDLLAYPVETPAQLAARLAAAAARQAEIDAQNAAAIAAANANLKFQQAAADSIARAKDAAAAAAAAEQAAKDKAYNDAVAAQRLADQNAAIAAGIMNAKYAAELLVKQNAAAALLHNTDNTGVIVPTPAPAVIPKTSIPAVIPSIVIHLFDPPAAPALTAAPTPAPTPQPNTGLPPTGQIISGIDENGGYVYSPQPTTPITVISGTPVYPDMQPRPNTGLIGDSSQINLTNGDSLLNPGGAVTPQPAATGFLSGLSNLSLVLIGVVVLIGLFVIGKRR